MESLSQDSSDEENEESDEEEQKAEVTSMDEALRTVSDTGDRSQENFLKQNFETLAESSSMGRKGQTHMLIQTHTHNIDLSGKPAEFLFLFLCVSGCFSSICQRLNFLFFSFFFLTHVVHPQLSRAESQDSVCLHASWPEDIITGTADHFRPMWTQSYNYKPMWILCAFLI